VSDARFIIRRAVKADAPALGRLGGLLLRTHFEFDRQRFLAPGDDPESGYAWFLASELAKDDVAVFVAEQDGLAIGYVYVGIEPQSWKELREECGFIHDIVVSAEGRRGGVATALIDTAIGWLKEQGAPRVMLWTAEPNEAAQKLFAKLGFRRTMIEMTRELE
jgi:ribosomal protein S18 acetylase RimI-like enzyme